MDLFPKFSIPVNSNYNQWHRAPKVTLSEIEKQENILKAELKALKRCSEYSDPLSDGIVDDDQASDSSSYTDYS